MAFEGADPVKLRELGSSFTRGATELDHIRSAIDGLVSQIDWHGADSVRFKHDWSSVLKPKVRNVHDLLTQASTDLKRQADEQDKASGSGSAANSLVGISGTAHVPGRGSDWDAFWEGFEKFAMVFGGMAALPEGLLQALGKFESLEKALEGSEEFSKAWKPFSRFAAALTFIEAFHGSASDSILGALLSAGMTTAVDLNPGFAIFDAVSGGSVGGAADMYATFAYAGLTGDYSHVGHELTTWSDQNMHGDNGWIMQTAAQAGNALTGDTDTYYQWGQDNLDGKNGAVLWGISNGEKWVGDNVSAGWDEVGSWF